MGGEFNSVIVGGGSAGGVAAGRLTEGPSVQAEGDARTAAGQLAPPAAI
jgi:hypothetical protein